MYTEVLPDVAEKEQQTDPWQLILYNDDVNTIDYVVEMLVAVCDHEEHQAYQCALIAHYKGSVQIKKGEYDILYAMLEALANAGISSSLDQF